MRLKSDKRGVLGMWDEIFIAASARTDEPEKEYDKGYSAQDASNRVKSAPASQETARLL